MTGHAVGTVACAVSPRPEQEGIGEFRIGFRGGGASLQDENSQRPGIMLIAYAQLGIVPAILFCPGLVWGCCPCRVHPGMGWPVLTGAAKKQENQPDSQEWAGFLYPN